VDSAVVMQEAAMPLRPGQLVRMHSMLGLVAAANGKTGVLKHTSQSVWVVMLEEPCMVGLHKKHELRVHPKYLTGLSQLPMSFSEKLEAALVAERHEMQESGALQVVRHIVPNPLAQAVHAGHTNVYDETVQLAFNAYLTECGVVVSTMDGSTTMASKDQHNEEMADMLEQQILAAFEARIETLGLRHKHRHAPDYVLIAALSVEYRNTCLAHHAAHSAAKQQQIDDALQKFTSQVHPCHNEGCVAQGQKNAFNATTGQFRSAICSRCKVVTYCSLSCQKEDWPKHKPFCREMTSAERRSNKCTIVQKYTKQTKAATAAVEQQLRTQIASMNCSDSAVLVSIRPSQLVRAHKMLLLEEVDVSGNTLDAAAQGAVCGHVGEFAGGAAGGDCLRKL